VIERNGETLYESYDLKKGDIAIWRGWNPDWLPDLGHKIVFILSDVFVARRADLSVEKVFAQHLSLYIWNNEPRCPEYSMETGSLGTASLWEVINR
jgi:hypothetical protein